MSETYTLPLNGYFASQGLTKAPTVTMTTKSWVYGTGPTRYHVCTVCPSSYHGGICSYDQLKTTYYCTGSLESGDLRLYQLNDLDGSVLCTTDSCTGTNTSL